MKTWMRLPILCCFTFLATACSRLAMDSNQVSIFVPQSVADKVTSLSLKLNHLAIQISGPGMQTILSIYDQNQGDIPLQVSYSLESGNDRVIQVLAAYSDSDDNDSNSTIYYGDETRTFSGGEVPIEVKLNALNGGQAVEEAHVQGRYLNAPASGPTGEVKMMFKPSGKPAMVVDTRKILGGWFEAVLFKNFPVDYVLPDGSFLLQQATIDNLPVSDKLARLYVPAHTRLEYQMNKSVPKPRPARSQFMGFFASNPSFLSDKKVCVQLDTMPAGSTLYMQDRYVGPDIFTGLPLQFFPLGTPPTIIPTKAAFIGGLPMISCGGLNASDEFNKHLSIVPAYFSNVIGQDFDALAGVQGFWVSPKSPEGYNYTPQFKYIGGNVPLIRASVLPGTAAGMDRIRIYSKPFSDGYGYGFGNNDCSEKNLQDWTFIKSIALSAVGNDVQFPYAEYPSVPNTHYYIACLAQGEKPVGRSLSVYNYNSVAPTQLQINGANSTALNQCTPFNIFLYHPTANMGMTFNPFTDLFVNLSSSETALHTTVDCTDAPVSNLPLIFAPGVISANIYIKPTSYSTIVLNTTNNKGLTEGTSQTIVTSPPTANAMVLSLDNSQALPPAIYANGCTPLQVSMMNGPLYANFSGTVTISIKNADGSLPKSLAGVNIVTSCTNKTPISSLSFAGEKIKTFALDVGSIPPTNFSLKLFTSGISPVVQSFNAAPVVDHIEISRAGVASTTVAQDECFELDAHIMNANGTFATLTGTDVVKFSINGLPSVANGSYPSFSMYSDDACTTSTSEATFTSSSSSLVTYVKATTMVSGRLGYISQYTTKSYNNYGDPSLSYLNVQVVPAALAAPGHPTTLNLNSSASFGITGGLPPYNLTISSSSPGAVASLSLSTATVTAGSSGGIIHVHITDSGGGILDFDINVP